MRPRVRRRPERTLEALNERRVQTLLLESGFDCRAGRCPSCGLLSLETHGPCPADGTELEELDNCDRVYVFREGRATARLEGEEIAPGRILAASFGEGGDG